MASSHTTTGSGNHSIHEIQHEIRGAVSRLKRRYYLLQSAASLVVFLLVVLGASGLEAVFFLSAPVKILLWIFAVGVALVAQQFIRHKLTYPNYRYVYRHLAYSYNFSELSHLLDLADIDLEHQSGFHRLAVKQNLDQISLPDFKQALQDFIKRHSVTRYFNYSASGLGLLILITGSLIWANGSPYMRFAQAWTGFTPPNPYSYAIYPGSATVEQGASFQPRIQFQGDEIPEEVTFVFKTEKEKEFRQRRMRAITPDSLVTDALNLSNDITYHIKMGDFASPDYSVDVQLKPRFSNLQLEITPPEYTKRASQSYTYPFSTIEVYPGSEILISAKSNKNLKKISLFRSNVGENDQELSIVRPDSFTTQFTAGLKDDTLRFTLADSTGLTNDNPFRFKLAKQQDEAPVATIHAPSTNLKLSEPEPVGVEYSAEDDFGLVKARLAYTLNRAYVDRPIKNSVSLKIPRGSDTEMYRWPLDTLDLKPRDKITYWIEVWDNDSYQGYKKGRSQKQFVTIPSMTDQFDEMDEKESEVSEDLDDISNSYEQMQEEYEGFKDKLKRNPQADWEHSRSLDDVNQKREEIQKKAEELNKKFQDLTKELKKNNMLSDETMKEYQELQKLMEKIDDPELMEQLQKLQQNLENMSQNELREAMEDIEFDEELYRERLQRTKDLFQKLKLNSDLEKMARSLDRLSKEEKELSESSDSASAEQQMKQQQDVQEDLEKVKEQLNKTNSDSAGFSKQIQQQLDSLDREMDSDFQETEEKIRKNLEELKKLQKQQSEQMEKQSGGSEFQENQGKIKKRKEQIRKQQQQIQDKLSRMSSKMRETKSNMNKEQKQINLAALAYIQQNLVMLSEDQERLNRETEDLSDRSAAFVEKARRQKTIYNEFEQLADSLTGVSGNIASLSSSFNRKKKEVDRYFNKSVEQLAERNKNQSTSMQRMSLGGVNEMASQLTSLIDQLRNQMSNQGGAGNMSADQFMKQLQNMSGQQKKLNDEIQKMINDIQGERLSRDQMKRLEQMAKQQNAIRKQLKKLQREGSVEGGEKLMSQMERMSEQMEDTINDLRGGSTDGQLIKRQQNILSKMLDAEKAMQERGKSEERKARRPEDFERGSSPQMTMEELRQEIRSRLNDPEQTRFKDDYQKLIEYYFRILEENQVQPETGADEQEEAVN